MLYIIIAILIFGLLIIIHELGHFAVAKACGICVEEFSVGMGPAIVQKTSGETTYSLRCIPFGGYCAMTGEDGESDDPRAFVNQSVWKKLLVLCAGSFMNFILGFVMVLLVYSGAKAFTAPIISDFMDGCPYNSADGLNVNDRFYKIDGHRIYLTSDITEYLDKSASHNIIVIRDGGKVTLENYAMERREYSESEDKLYGFYLGYDEASPAVRLSNAKNTTFEFVRWVWAGLGELFSGNASVNDLSGPVGIVDMMAQTGEQAQSTADGVLDVLYFGAFIAVNLAVMNMLPIPALDGGRVFTLLVSWPIEKITGKKINPKIETYIHAAGMIVLLAFMAFVMFNDIWKLLKG